MNKIIIIKTRSYGFIDVRDFRVNDVIVLDKGGHLDRGTAYATKVALQARGMVGDREYILRYESPEEAIQKLENTLRIFRYSYGRTEGYANIQQAISQLDSYTQVACDRIVTVPSAPATRTVVYRREPTIASAIEDIVDIFLDQPTRTREVTFG